MKLTKDYGNKWDTWFAWYPKFVNGRWVWLETVEKLYNVNWNYWSYREIQE